MPTSHFKLNLTPAGSGSTIEMDGEQLDNVKAISVRTDVENGTLVTVEFALSRVEIRADAELRKICRMAADVPRGT